MTIDNNIIDKILKGFILIIECLKYFSKFSANSSIAASTISYFILPTNNTFGS